MLVFASLMFGTFISEDLACVTAGLLIQRGEIGAPAGILACTLGIVVGDIGLWGVGRWFGRAVLAWPWVGGQVQDGRFCELRSRLDRYAAGAIVASRFLPGTRLPLYVIAGILELPAGVFASWALVGATLWVPALVLGTARLGDSFSTHIPLTRFGWIGQALIGLGMVSLLQLLRGIDWRRDRRESCESGAVGQSFTMARGGIGRSVHVRGGD